MSLAVVERNKETGEFSCIVGGEVLAKGRSGAAISRLYDIEASVNAGGIPNVKTRGHGETREFDVCIGDYVYLEGQGAIKAYRNLDALEKALALEPPLAISGFNSVRDGNLTITKTEMPEVPVPALTEADDQITSLGFSPPVYETDDGKGNRFEEQYLLSSEPLAEESQP